MPFVHNGKKLLLQGAKRTEVQMVDANQTIKHVVKKKQVALLQITGIEASPTQKELQGHKFL